MRKSTTDKSVLKNIAKLIKDASKKYNVPPYDVSSAQFWTVADGKVDEWQIRKLGGFTGIRGLEFPAPPGRESRDDILPRTTSSSIKKQRYRAPRLENFTVHDTNLRELFKLAKLKDTDVLRVLVQPDTHVPEHDPTALNAFMKFAEYYKPHGYVNLGDFMEMDSVSHWEPKDTRPRRLAPEVKIAKGILKDLDKALGPQCVYKRFLVGNHEDWLDQLLIAKVPEVVDDLEELGVDLSIKSLLGLKDLGYRVVPLNEILRLGELHFIHGYYTSKYHAFKHLEVFGVNLMYGHLHDVQSFSGVSVKGVHEAISIGCLRVLNAPFMKGKPNNWSHAFGIVEFRIDGSYTRYVPIITDGKFSFHGKTFDGKC